MDFEKIDEIWFMIIPTGLVVAAGYGIGYGVVRLFRMLF